MAEKSAESAFPVRVVEDELAEDLTHATEAARAAIKAVVDELRDGGAPVDWLRPCEAEARDGTELADCVKLYIPRPAGQWGAVLSVDRETSGPALVLLAVGERHPGRPWRPSVYQIAHRRLHAGE